MLTLHMLTWIFSCFPNWRLTCSKLDTGCTRPLPTTGHTLVQARNRNCNLINQPFVVIDPTISRSFITLSPTKPRVNEIEIIILDNDYALRLSWKPLAASCATCSLLISSSGYDELDTTWSPLCVSYAGAYLQVCRWLSLDSITLCLTAPVSNRRASSSIWAGYACDLGALVRPDGYAGIVIIY